MFFGWISGITAMIVAWITSLPTTFVEWIKGMTTTELIGQILGILVIIGCILNAQLPKRWQMLLGQVFLNILSPINMLLLGQGLAAGLPCFVASLHCAVNLIRDRKNKPAPLWETIIFCALYPITWGVGFAISVHNGTASPLHLIPLLALAFFIASVLAPKENLMRWFIIGNSAVYVVYDLITPNVAVFAFIFTIVSAVIALIRYRKSSPKATKTK